MKNFTEIIKKIKAPSIKDNIELIKSSKAKKDDVEIYKISKEIDSYNLYLYLFTRFGKPNGLLSLFRKEDSDQMFHWHYTFEYNDSIIQIMCTTYRIEVSMPTNLVSSKDECISFLKQLIKDIQNYKVEVTKTRKIIENWEMIVNPFAKIQKQINIFIDEIENLVSEIPDFKHSHIYDIELSLEEFSKWAQLTEELSAKSYALKCLVPVYIETFLNFTIQILAKQEIKDDREKFEEYIREQIHIKIQKLHRKCIGFIFPIDWEHDICKSIHTIFNKRNDLLHGNFNIKSLKYGEVGFIKNMPLFKKFSSFQEDILNLSLATENSNIAIKEIEDAQLFMMYILINLDTSTRKQLKRMLESYTLGWNKSTKRFGILFNNNSVDFKVG